MKKITLKWPARCADCAAALAPGTEAKFYGRGRIYGISCHAKPASSDANADASVEIALGIDEPRAA